MLFCDHDDALFLDVDGTLLEIAPTPDAVQVPRHLIELVYQLSDLLEGAVALISGRPMDDIDRLFRPYLFPGIGAHGCERRGLDGVLKVADVDPKAINQLHDDCARFVGDSPDLLAEYKRCGVAIHCRLASQRAAGVRDYLQQLAWRAGPSFAVICGRDVYEIKPSSYSRSAAILEMMDLRPFHGRRPVYIGNDLGQEAFDAVNRVGGMTIEVGTCGPSAAQLRIASVSNVHAVLAALLDEQRSQQHLH